MLTAPRSDYHVAVHLLGSAGTHRSRRVTAASPSQGRSDQELMARVRAGDDRSLGVLYDRHVSLVYSLAHAIVGEDADAEEVTEEVFVQLWSDADRFDPSRGALKSWLATMARSRALDHVRSDQRRRSAHERAASRDREGLAIELSNPDPADWSAVRSELRDALDRALGHLNEDQRRALELAYFGGLTQSEIAGVLDEPLGTIKTRIRDGMAKLRKQYRQTAGFPT